MTSAKRAVPAAVVLAAATVGSWAAWLSWTTGYRTDPDTGAVSGPYSWWQAAGCVATLAVLAAIAGRWLRPLVVAAVMAGTLTVAWSVPAAAADETGLWLVGAVLVFAGTLAGASLAARLGRRRGTPARD